MKTKLTHIILFLALLCSCSSEDYDRSLPQGGEALQIATVRVSGFVTDGTSDSRATESDEKTAFEAGDRMGIIVLGENGQILSGNIPYKYNGSAWSFDSNNGEGKTIACYDNKATACVAYFPYSKDADGISSIEGLKSKFQPLPDQRGKDAYRASDLLVWSQTYETFPRKLEIAFEHAYCLLSLPSVSIACNINGSSTATQYSSSLISDVSFTLGGTPYSAYKSADGSNRIITVPQGVTTSDRWFFTYGGKTYSGAMPSSTLSAKSGYALSPSLGLGNYSLDDAKMGDFYCKSSHTDGSTTGYLIPVELKGSLSDDQKNACLGIVMKAGKDASGDWKDNGSYTLKGTTTEMSTIHGYVLALKDGNIGSDGKANTCAWGPYGIQVYTDQSQCSLFCGYTNTQIIKNYVSTHSDNSLQNDFPAAYHASEGYESIESGKYSSPSNSSGWFLPSAGQCWYWYQNREVLKESMEKAGGDGWYDYYWSSSEDSDGPASNAWYVSFRHGGVDGGSKNYSLCRVRSCLAF